MKAEGIIPILEIIEGVNSGVCLVMCSQGERAHYTDLGASTLVSDNFCFEALSKLSNLKLIFTELFILKHKRDVVYKLAEHCADGSKLFGFNLPSFYFITTYLDDILNLIAYADIVFANLEEAIFLGNLLKIEVKYI